MYMVGSNWLKHSVLELFSKATCFCSVSMLFLFLSVLRNMPNMFAC